jgi:hypothetical protein
LLQLCRPSALSTLQLDCPSSFGPLAYQRHIYSQKHVKQPGNTSYLIRRTVFFERKQQGRPLLWYYININKENKNERT